MADKSIMISFRISAQNAQILESISKELHISKSSILNDLLNKHLQTSQHLVKLNALLKDDEQPYKTIKIKCTKNQYDALKIVAQNMIIGSVPKLIKFCALDMIYENKLLNNKELEALALTRAELHKIGSNINQIARALNTQSEANIASNLLTTLECLDSKLTKISAEIKALCCNSQGVLR